MNKLMTFFRTLGKSVSDPHYGNDIIKAPSSFSWKYFLLFNLLTALVTGAMVMMPVVAFDVTKTVTESAEIYPQDLEIRGDQSGLSINQPLPYSVPIPKKYYDDAELADEDMIQNVVTFTSDEAITGIDDVYDYQSFAVVTESTFYFLKDMDTGEMRVERLPEFEEPFTINRSVVNNAVTSLLNQPLIKQKLYIPFIAAALLILLYPLMLLSRIITVAIYSLVMLLLINMFMKGRGLTYSKVFQLSLHTITPVIVAAYILDGLRYNFLQGFIYFLAYAAWTLFVVSKIGFVKAHSTPVVTPAVVKSTSKSKSKTT